MSDDTKERDMAAQVSGLPEVAARTAFRERLRQGFVAGTLPQPVDASPVLVPDRRRPWWWELRPLWAAVSLGVLLAVGAMFNRGPTPVVVGHTDIGTITIDGVPVNVADGAAWSSLHAGSEIQTSEDASLDVLYEDLALIEIAPGTTVTLPGSPGRWLGKSVSSRLDAGEIRFKSGARFPGNLLAVTTPQGRAEITGTTVSVQVGPMGTCVCVLEGHVKVGVDKADMAVISPGSRKVMPPDGPPSIEPIKAMHEAGVRQFTDTYGHYVTGTD